MSLGEIPLRNSFDRWFGEISDIRRQLYASHSGSILSSKGARLVRSGGNTVSVKRSPESSVCRSNSPMQFGILFIRGTDANANN